MMPEVRVITNVRVGNQPKYRIQSGVGYREGYDVDYVVGEAHRSITQRPSIKNNHRRLI